MPTGVMSGVIQTPLWLAKFPAVDGKPDMGFTVAIYDIDCLKYRNSPPSAD